MVQRGNLWERAKQASRRHRLKAHQHLSALTNADDESRRARFGDFFWVLRMHDTGKRFECTL
jgi:hypothetical protein